MFQLHDKTRRRTGLAAFFLLCVVPTVIVLACGVARHLPGHVQAEAKRLTWQLGQKVSLKRVRRPQPGVVIYERLDLSDPETGGRILRCATLEARWETSRDPGGRSRRWLVLTATRPEIEAAELDHLWRLVQGILACRSGTLESDVRLAAGELTLRQGETSHTLTGLEGTIEKLSGAVQADVGFRLAGLETPGPVQIRAMRNQQMEPPATGLGVHTGGGPLPCSLLALGSPTWEALGPQSQFRGYLWTNETPQGWCGELVGDFTGVDLDGLLARHFFHTLRGTAQLTVQESRFLGGRLEKASGSLVAGPGVISRSLLDAAADRMGMVRGPEPNAPGRLVSYERLAVSFLIDARGLQLRGDCPPSGSGAILIGRQGLLLGEPALQPVPMAALVQTLVPFGAVQVPATRQTDWLMRRLPVPYVIPPRTAEASSPAAD